MSVPKLIAKTGRAEIATTEVDIRVYRSCMMSTLDSQYLIYKSLKKRLAVVLFFAR